MLYTHPIPSLPPLPHPWQWDSAASSQSRKLRITVDANRLLVRLRFPPRTSQRGIERFLSLQQAWLQEKLACVVPPKRPETGCLLSILGRQYQLHIHDDMRQLPHLHNEHILHIGGGAHHAPARLRRYIQHQLHQWIQPELATLCQQIQHQPPPKCATPEMHSRWGSCSPHRNHIRLNWRLAFAPPAILHYVLAHEVAHLRHLNHGPEFWKLTQSLTPSSVPHARRWLRNHGHELYTYQF